MGSLFGSKMGGIIDLVSSVAGVKKSSSSGLLGMVGPLVMSYLGRKIRKEGLNAFGLSKFLGGQSANIASALPAGMGDLVGFAKNASGSARETVSRAASTASGHVENNTGGGEQLDKVKDAAGDAAGAVTDAAGDAVGKVGDIAEGAVDAAGNAAEKVGDP